MENLHVAGNKDSFPFWKRRLSHSYRQNDTHRRQLRPLERRTTQQKHAAQRLMLIKVRTVKGLLDGTEYCWWLTPLTTPVPHKTRTFSYLPAFLKKTGNCKIRNVSLIYNHSSLFCIWMRMHLIVGRQVKKLHGLPGLTTSHYLVSHRLLQRSLAQFKF